MSKKSLVRSVPFVTAIVLISTTLACGIADDYFRSPEEVKASREASDRERTEMALEETEEEEYYATHEVVRSTDMAQQTMIAGMPEEEVKATLFAEEACIAQGGKDFSLEYTEPVIEKGRRCTYDLIIHNKTDETLTCVFFWVSYESKSLAFWTHGYMVWANQSITTSHRYTTYSGDLADTWDDSWEYGTKIVVVRKIPECEWLLTSEEGKMKYEDIFEAYATPLEVLCPQE
jgi:hypothetical protein